MPRRKNTSHLDKIKSFHQKNLKVSIFLFLIFLAIFFYGIIYIHQLFASEPKPVTELPDDVKQALAKTDLNATGSAQANPPSQRNYKIPILLYHYVEYVKDKGDKVRQSLNIEPWAFDEQVKTLKDAGFTFMTMKDVSDVLDGKINLPEKPVVLTFDDGYWDLDTDVLPILRKYNVKATAYIVPDFINRGNNLTYTQLVEVDHSGLVEVGAHTMDHVYLKGMNHEKAKQEIEQSKQILEKELGHPVVSFAYPYGAFDLSTVEIVKEAGFTTATTTIPGVDASVKNRLFLYRVRPGYRTGANLVNYLMSGKYQTF